VLPGAPLEAPRSERLLTMKRVKEQRLELQPGQWWVEQSKGKPIKRPSSRRRRPLPNNNSSRKPKQRPRTNRVSTNLRTHFLPAWTLADTPLNSDLRDTRIGLVDYTKLSRIGKPLRDPHPAVFRVRVLTFLTSRSSSFFCPSLANRFKRR